MNRKILVVDDDTFIRECCAELLTGAGYSVDTADNGLAALKRLDAGVYDMVISDVTMPGLNGIGLYMKVEKEHHYLASRFLFITGVVPSDPESAAILTARKAAVLVKPFEPSALIQKVALMTLTPLSEYLRAPGVNMRRQERIFCFFECMVFPDEAPVNGIEARALDISANGFCVRYPGPPLEILKKVALRLKTQSMDLPMGYLLERRGVVRWSKGSNGFATSGVEIEEGMNLSAIKGIEHRA